LDYAGEAQTFSPDFASLPIGRNLFGNGTPWRNLLFPLGTEEENIMKPDRSLIGAVVLLATGMGLILKYCQGTTAFNIAYPFSGSTLHIDLTTTGPAVLGGLSLIAIGLLFLLWSLIAAIVHQIVLLVGSRDDRMDSIIGRHREPLFEADHYPGTMTMAERKNEG
jgi:hypothetical protein